MLQNLGHPKHTSGQFCSHWCLSWFCKTELAQEPGENVIYSEIKWRNALARMRANFDPATKVLQGMRMQQSQQTIDEQQNDSVASIDTRYDK